MASQILAAIFSFFIPGLGQFYAGSFLRGLLVFLFSIILSSVIVSLSLFLLITIIAPIILGLFTLVFWIWNIIDAYQLAGRN